MFVFFFRHGDRASGTDPSLSETGQKQAQNLLPFLEQNRIILPDVLWVSPRQRAQQTFAVLAHAKNLTVEVHPEIDERKANENADAFRRRVQTVVKHLPTLHKNIFLCSHLDWLEEAMTCIPDQGKIQLGHFFWPPGGFIEFEIDDHNWNSTRQGQVAP